MCADEYVQKMTFDSYLYKTVVPGNPIDDFKLLVRTVGSLIRANALRQSKDGLNVSFGRRDGQNGNESTATVKSVGSVASSNGKPVSSMDADSEKVAA